MILCHSQNSWKFTAQKKFFMFYSISYSVSLSIEAAVFFDKCIPVCIKIDSLRHWWLLRIMFSYRRNWWEMYDFICCYIFQRNCELQGFHICASVLCITLLQCSLCYNLRHLAYCVLFLTYNSWVPWLSQCVRSVLTWNVYLILLNIECLRNCGSLSWVLACQSVISWTTMYYLWSVKLQYYITRELCLCGVKACCHTAVVHSSVLYLVDLNSYLVWEALWFQLQNADTTKDSKDTRLQTVNISSQFVA